MTGKFISTTLQHFLNEQNQESIKLNDNFWKWFGDSKVVDMDGKPMICYHGTPKGEFLEFQPKIGYKGKPKQQVDLGSHFSIDKEYASGYAGNKKTPKVYECFLRIENPLHTSLLLWKEDDVNLFNKHLNFITDVFKRKMKINGDFYYNKEGIKQQDIQCIIVNNFLIDSIPSNTLYNGLIKHGFDGVFHEPYNMEGIRQFKSHPKAYIALYGNQIKSVDNDGSWDLDDKNMYS
jgi:hypothetical protein